MINTPNSNFVKFLILSVFCLFISTGFVFRNDSKSINFKIDRNEKKVEFGNEKIKLILDYKNKANISFLSVNGQKVIDDSAGIHSEIKTVKATYSSLKLLSEPILSIDKNSMSLEGIQYGDHDLKINERWIFTISDTTVRFDIKRNLSKSILAERISFPVFRFSTINTWEGAYQDYGGLAWFYLFNKKMDTYGVHSNTSDFWNSKTGNGLTIAVDAPSQHVAMDYSRTADDRLAYTIAIASSALQARFDSVTHRRLFLRDTDIVWAPTMIDTVSSHQSITLSYFDFEKKYGRGLLRGIPGDQVSAVLNTIARIGVIGKNHFGGNSWHTPYGPICLHEQYIAQMGLAINDPAYLKGYQQCLDYYRDNAIKPDGRVWPRWAYSNEDAMPNGFTDKGFYEAQWGYLLDANPDFVTNVAELYDQNGDLDWVKTQKTTCEHALEWIISRDKNDNGLVEMMTDSHKQKRGSDWIDIIWAAYENAFVNAKLYHALVLWSDIEKQIGDTSMANYYESFAEKLKVSFNKPTRDGGFWDDEKKCFIHWRDKDGSIHGNNMVTPVNFMAIAYGICDDTTKKKSILDTIEIQMQKENLFFWPLCMYSYAPGEGNDWQFPFPNYENGDIFLSWGAVAVKAYAAYKPELAVKYVKNVLNQYSKDGLAFQRYGRNKQDGLGDDILSGNSLAVVGLYQAIYGINPLYNRFYLDPHITAELSGTEIKYNYRGQRLTVGLDSMYYTVANDRYKIICNHDFGFFNANNELQFFNHKQDRATLKVSSSASAHLTLEIKECKADQVSWIQSTIDKEPTLLTYQINHLKKDHNYSILINNKLVENIKSDKNGSLLLKHTMNSVKEEIVIKYK